MNSILNTIRAFNVKFKDEYGEMVLCSDAADPWRRDIFPNYKHQRRKGRVESQIDWEGLFYIMSNIFGYRSTDPKNLYNIEDPIGPDNNYWLQKLQNETTLTIGAWGNHGKLLNRGNEVIELLDSLHCLKITKEGHPSHPLYLPSKLRPISFK